MTGRPSASALARRALWRTVLALTGGLRVQGASALPAGPCVIVANHRSHADTAALLAAGRDVIIFPEGTRSRDGRTGDFHRGAARLAAAAGVPLVPAGLSGTATLLPPGGSARRLRRVSVIVRFGAPVSLLPPTGTAGDALTDATAQARAQVTALVTD